MPNATRPTLALMGSAYLLALTVDAHAQPYPASSVIRGVSFDRASLESSAPGSDNWPMTWAADGHQYAAFGDGGGFGGDNSLGRVSLGLARIEGTAADHRGVNVNGGQSPEHASTLSGKSYGVLAIGDVLYLWRSPGSGPTNYSEARLMRSDDGGASFTEASWSPASTPRRP